MHSQLIVATQLTLLMSAVACGGGLGGGNASWTSGAPGGGGAPASGGASNAGGLTSPASVATLRTDGNRLLDTCGNELVIRGVEQILGEQLPPGNDWVGLIDEIAATGANAVRVLFAIRALSVADMDAVLTRIGSHGMVAFVSPTLPVRRTWFGEVAVRAMLAGHSSYLIIDGGAEPEYNDRERFLTDTLAAVDLIRGYGYTEPIVAQTNLYGRDLPSALQLGAQIVERDPLSNTIIGWQACWGDSGWYQGRYGMRVGEGVEAVAEAAFPIQVGINYITDWNPIEHLDYGAVMTAAQTHGVGWLWWDWYNPYGPDNSLSSDGSHNNLVPVGLEVVNTHPASIANTSALACRPD